MLLNAEGMSDDGGARSAFEVDAMMVVVRMVKVKVHIFRSPRAGIKWRYLWVLLWVFLSPFLLFFISLSPFFFFLNILLNVCNKQRFFSCKQENNVSSSPYVKTEKNEFGASLRREFENVRVRNRENKKKGGWSEGG